MVLPLLLLNAFINEIANDVLPVLEYTCCLLERGMRSLTGHQYSELRMEAHMNSHYIGYKVVVRLKGDHSSNEVEDDYDAFFTIFWSLCRAYFRFSEKIDSRQIGCFIASRANFAFMALR